MSSFARGAQRLWSAYETQLTRAPVTTQIATSTILWCNSSPKPEKQFCRPKGSHSRKGSGDILSQLIEGRNKWNPQRTLYASAFGGLLLGPTGHFWYKSLDSLVGKYVTRGTTKFILSKVALDEALFGPLHVLGFFTFMTKAEGGSWQDVKEKIQQDFLSTYVAELAIWPAYQTFNFAKVPVRHQLLFVNSGCLIDATFLCWVKNQDDWLATLGLKKADVQKEVDEKLCRQ